MIILGLTGSIGMGKSSVSAMFAEHSVPIWDADAEVHNLYEFDEDIYKFILANFPEACRHARVDRAILGSMVFGDPVKLKELERVFGHTLEVSMAKFIAAARWAPLGEQPLVVLDIPLLLENRHLVRQCDYVVVVRCSAEEQRARVLARPGMTEERFAMVLQHQMPSAEKERAADIIIDTSLPMLEVRQRVDDIVANVSDDDWVMKQALDENGLFTR